jgi:hypothetical protein
MYLTAALYCDGSPSPAPIRNISPTGALVEAAAVPSEGALVQLVRADLIVHALVAWSAETRCGLKFSGRIDVDRWCAAPANSEQRRVDEVVRLVKAGAVPLPVARLGHSVDRNEVPDSPGAVSRDLKRVSDLLDSLGDALASDSDLVSRHGSALQNLDIATQVIVALDATITGEGDPSGTKLVALRTIADQALQRAVQA